MRPLVFGRWDASRHSSMRSSAAAGASASSSAATLAGGCAGDDTTLDCGAARRVGGRSPGLLSFVAQPNGAHGWLCIGQVPITAQQHARQMAVRTAKLAKPVRTRKPTQPSATQLLYRTRCEGGTMRKLMKCAAGHSCSAGRGEGGQGDVRAAHSRPLRHWVTRDQGGTDCDLRAVPCSDLAEPRSQSECVARRGTGGLAM
jgi:hypothetical protein